MNTCWEYFTYNDKRYKRQYFTRVFWMKFRDNSPHKSNWVNVYDFDILEEQYQEYTIREKRDKKLNELL